MAQATHTSTTSIDCAPPSSVSRRKALTAILATATIGVPVAALASVEPDPVFAAIERWRGTYAALDEVGHRLSEVEDRYIDECERIKALQIEDTSKEAWQDFLNVVREYRPETTEDEALKLAKCLMRQTARKACGLEEIEAIQAAACDTNADAVIELAATVPTTPAGALALLTTFREAERRGDGVFEINDCEDGVALDYLFDSIEEFLRNSKAEIAA